MYRSEARRRAGIRLRRSLGLVRCPGCGSFLVVRDRQQTRLCAYCNRRFWLDNAKIVFRSDDAELLRKIAGGTGNYYRPGAGYGFCVASALVPSRAASFAKRSSPGSDSVQCGVIGASSARRAG